MNDEFMNRIVDAVVESIKNSGLIAKYVAEEVGKQPDLMAQVVDALDPALLAKEFARHTEFLANHKHARHAGYMPKLNVINKRAEELAAERIAQNITEAVSHV